MRFPSFPTLVDAARTTLLRFPLVLLSGLCSAAASIHMIDQSSDDRGWFDFIMVTALGIPLFLALDLLGEKSPSGRPLRRRWLLWLPALAFLAGYGWLLHQEPGDSRYLRYCQVALAAHLFVSFAPFLARGEVNGFWQFNRRLFLRFALSAVYATVFFGGLALALLAVDNLFDVDVDEKLYPELWLFTVFVFQTWHFLAGVPRELARLDADHESPKGLRVFTQYMLVPLVILYMAILYAYMGKIVLTRTWPQGWVGWLVSYASLFGVLTLLLLQGGREANGERWVRVFRTSFHAGVLPLIGLLFIALWKRVSQYGMTERRYFLMVLGLWLAALSLYILLSAAKSHKTVPVSLCLVALATSAGPWGAYQVSLRSQAGRLQSLLVKNNLLSEGHLVKTNDPVPQEDLKEISQATLYLAEHHGAGTLHRWSRNPELRATKDDRGRRSYDVSRLFLEEMGLEFVPHGRGDADIDYYNSGMDALDVQGYEWMVPTHFMVLRDPGKDPEGYSVRLVDDGRAFEIRRGTGLVIRGSLAPLTQAIRRVSASGRQDMSSDDMSLVLEGGGVRVKLVLRSVSLERHGDGADSVRNGEGYLLVDHTP